MARQVRSARGDLVDFDEILIKQQLAAAPMNIEVERRKNFIDSQETTARARRQQPELIPIQDMSPEAKKSAAAADFENDNPGIDSGKKTIEAVPVIPDRKSKQ